MAKSPEIISAPAAPKAGGTTLAPFSFDGFSPVDGYAPDPYHMTPGTPVTITGTGLHLIARVKFNGVDAGAIAHVSDTMLKVNVPDGASSGPISIDDGKTTLYGPRDFTVDTPIPYIDHFVPTSGPVGTAVSIFGHHLATVDTVLFNKTTSNKITPGANQRVDAVVPPGATNGFITVRGSNGSDTSRTKFKVT